jgi:hypothetical protein
MKRAELLITNLNDIQRAWQAAKDSERVTMTDYAKIIMLGLEHLSFTCQYICQYQPDNKACARVSNRLIDLRLAIQSCLDQDIHTTYSARLIAAYNMRDLNRAIQNAIELEGLHYSEIDDLTESICGIDALCKAKVPRKLVRQLRRDAGYVSKINGKDSAHSVTGDSGYDSFIGF